MSVLRLLAIAVLVIALFILASAKPVSADASSWSSSLSSANALVAKGSPADAERQFVLAWQDVSMHGQPMDQLLVLLQKGGNEIALNDYATALQTFQTGVAIARQNNLSQPLGDMLAYSAECCRLSKSFDLALSNARDARAAYESANDTPDESFTFVIEGRIYQDQGNPNLALTAFNQSLALAPYNFAAVRGTAECDKALGDFAGAEQALVSALPHETGSNENLTSQLLGDCYLDWARSLADKNDEAGAIATLRKAIQVYAQGQPARVAEALAWLGDYLSGRGHIMQALAVDKSALALSAKVKSNILQFYALSSLATDYQRSGQSPLAFSAASQAITVAISSDDKSLPPKAYAVAELIADDNGYGDLAQSYAQREWRAAQQADDPQTLATAAKDLGFQYFLSADYRASLVWYGAAAKYEPPGSNTLTRRQTLLDTGMTYGRLGDTALDQRYFTQDAKLSDQAADYASERNAILADAAFQALAQRVDVAGELLNQLLSLLKSHPEVGDPTGQLGVQIGNIMLGVGQYTPAQTVLREALSQARQSGAKDVEAQADLALGYLHDQLHEYRPAAAYYRSALALYTTAGNNRQIAQTLFSLGAEEIHAGDMAAARASMTRAVKLESEFGDPADHAIMLSTLGYLYASEGDLAAASVVEKASIGLLQGLRPGIQALGSTYDANFIRDFHQIYESLAECLIRQGRLDEAEQVIDLIKVREFDQFQSRGGSGLAAAVPLTAAESSWQTRYQAISGTITALGRAKETLLARQALAKSGQGTFTPQDEKRLAAVNSDLAVADQAFDAFLSGVPKEFANPSLGAQKSSEISQVAAMRSTLRSLGPGAVLVYTLVEDDKYRAIVVTGETQKAEQYPIDSRKLAAKIFAFRALIQDPDSDPRPAAKELYNIIVGPIATDLAGAGATTVLWSLDGVLRYVPIDALYDGRQYMVERYSNVLYTLTSPALAASPPKATWDAVGMGVSKAQPGFEALPSVPDELHEVVRETAGTSGVLPGEIMLDNQFTKSSFLDALQQKKYEVVHIASHYAFHPGTDEDSFLLLGDGTHLSLAAIDALPGILNGVDLVTLSACNTAMGEAGGDGREIDGLAFTAEREGAQAVLATLWPIADESTQLLMKNFYAYYESHPNATKADALRYAQLTLLHGSAGPTTILAHRGDPLLTTPEPDAPAFPYDPKAPYAHPYFWAPFILLGNVR